MKTERKFPYARITVKQEVSVRRGHPWIYADEITEQSEQIDNGGFVDVFSQKGSYLGTGFYSENSKIRIRLLGNNANETYGDAFFERKAAYAVAYRKDVMKEDLKACRLVHGEADGLPGLTVDRYNNILVTQVESYGTEMHKDVIYAALVSELEKMGDAYEKGNRFGNRCLKYQNME